MLSRLADEHVTSVCKVASTAGCKIAVPALSVHLQHWRTKRSRTYSPVRCCLATKTCDQRVSNTTSSATHLRRLEGAAALGAGVPELHFALEQRRASA